MTRKYQGQKDQAKDAGEKPAELAPMKHQRQESGLR
jgi:hypothetical protein